MEDVKMVTEAIMKQGDASADQAMAIGREWLQNLIYQPGETIPFYNLGRDAINKLVGQLPASVVKDLEFKNGIPYRDGIPLTGQHIKQLYDKVTSHPIYSTLQEAGRKALGAGTSTTPQPELVTAMQKFLYMGGVLKAKEEIPIPEFIDHPDGLVDADGNPIQIRHPGYIKNVLPTVPYGEELTHRKRSDTYDPDREEGGAGTSSRAGGSVGQRRKQKRHRLKSYDPNKRKDRR